MPQPTIVGRTIVHLALLAATAIDNRIAAASAEQRDEGPTDKVFEPEKAAEVMSPEMADAGAKLGCASNIKAQSFSVHHDEMQYERRRMRETALHMVVHSAGGETPATEMVEKANTLYGFMLDGWVKPAPTLADWPVQDLAREISRRMAEAEVDGIAIDLKS